MKKTFKIEFSKRVPIVEAEGAKWLVDTGCPFSYPLLSIGETMASFLNVPGLRMMGVDRLGIYTLIDYQTGIITCSDEPISFEGTSVPLMMGTGSRPYVRMSVGGKEVEAYLDTGAAISYLRGLDRTKCRLLERRMNVTRMATVGQLIRLSFRRVSRGFPLRLNSATIRKTPCSKGQLTRTPSSAMTSSSHLPCS